MKNSYDILIEGNHSCVILKDNLVKTFNQRGIKDLYEIYSNSPELLNNCEIADKVVGKGAAAIMCIGKIKQLKAKVISQDALTLLNNNGIEVNYDTLTPYIINRQGTDRCPLETSLANANTAEECWPLIVKFINSMTQTPKKTNTSILFVCHGNICRSPMAEFVMKELVKQEGQNHYFYEISSAATSTEEIGNEVYPPVQRLLNKHGIDCSGKIARQMTPNDYLHYDYIIAMDHNNLRNIKHIIGEDKLNKISLLMDYTSRPRDVTDPWYTRNFEATWYDINEGCRCLLKKIHTERLKE